MIGLGFAALYRKWVGTVCVPLLVVHCCVVYAILLVPSSVLIGTRETYDACHRIHIWLVYTSVATVRVLLDWCGDVTVFDQLRRLPVDWGMWKFVFIHI